MEKHIIKREVEPQPTRPLVTFGDGTYGDLWSISPAPWTGEGGSRWYTIQFRPEQAVLTLIKEEQVRSKTRILDEESNITLTINYPARHVLFLNPNPSSYRILVMCGLFGEEDTIILQANKDRDEIKRIDEKNIYSLKVKLAKLQKELDVERSGTKTSLRHYTEAVKIAKEATGYPKPKEEQSPFETEEDT